MTPVPDPTGERLAIARYLASCPVPPWGDAAAAALGLTPDRWWRLAGECRWFAFDAPGPAGWTLTAEGTAAVAAAGPLSPASATGAG